MIKRFCGDVFTILLLLSLNFYSGRALASDGRDMFGREVSEDGGKKPIRKLSPEHYDPPAPVSELNTSSNEADPFLTNDGLKLYFSSDRPGGYGGYDLYVSERADPSSPFGEAVNLGPDINTTTNEIQPSVSFDGSDLYFVLSEGDWDSNEMNIARRLGDTWNLPRPLITLNTGASESFPFLSSDGKTLYFTSNRPGSAGDDLWFASRDGSTYGVPVRLPYLNTAADERALRLRADDEEAFFTRALRASPNSDVMVTVRGNPTDYFRTAIALPALASDSPENSPSASANDAEVFFSSNMPGGTGGYDLWRSEYGDVIPTPIAPVIIDLATSATQPVNFLIIEGETTITENLTINGGIASGDVNGDGYGDVILSTRMTTRSGQTGRGEAGILYGRPDWNSRFIDFTQPAGSFGDTRLLSYEDPFNDQVDVQTIGHAVACADLNGDGFDDVAVSGTGPVYGRHPDPVLFDSRVYIAFGSSDLPGQSIPMQRVDGPANVTFLLTPYNQIASPLSTGDLDGDGFQDLVFGGIIMFGPLPVGETIDLRNDEPGSHGETRFLKQGQVRLIRTRMADINADGYDDMLGDMLPDPPDTYRMSFAIFYGGPHLRNRIIDLEDLAASSIPVSTILYPYADTPQFPAPTDPEWPLYNSVRPSMGDFDADGRADVLSSDIIYGRALYPQLNFPVDLASLIEPHLGVRLHLRLSFNYDYSGAAFDMNADGRDDPLLFHPTNWGIFGPETFGGKLQGYLSTPDLPGSTINIYTTPFNLQIKALRKNTYLATQYADTLDVNRDGNPDILLGAASGVDYEAVGAPVVPGYDAVIFGANPALEASRRQGFNAGRTGLRGIGGRMSPVLRTWLGFNEGNKSSATVTLHRSKDIIENLGDGQRRNIANVLWRVQSDRTGTTTTQVAFRFTNAEIQGIVNELQLFQAPAPAGPWTLVENAVFDMTRNQVSAEVTSLGYFALLAKPVFEFFIDFTLGAPGWYSGVVAGEGELALNDSGLCMTAPLPGDNLLGWVSPNGYLPLIDTTVLQLAIQATSDQTVPDAIPAFDFIYDNFPANLYGGEMILLDVAGGANGISRPQGLKQIEMWAMPAAVETLQWRGLLDNGVPGENNESPFSPQFDPHNDMRLVFRLLDLGSAGFNANADAGAICISSLHAKGYALSSFESEELVLSTPISTTTYGAETFDQMGAGTAMIDDVSHSAHFQLLAGGLGSRKTLFPNDQTPGVVSAFYPIPWVTGALYKGTMMMSSDVVGQTPGGEGSDPLDLISAIFDTATNEIIQVHLVTRGSPGNMGFAASPRLKENTGGVAQPYSAIFFGHNRTASESVAAQRFRMQGDFANYAEIAPQGVGADPFAVETMNVNRLVWPW